MRNTTIGRPPVLSPERFVTLLLVQTSPLEDILDLANAGRFHTSGDDIVVLVRILPPPPTLGTLVQWGELLVVEQRACSHLHTTAHAP